MLSFCEKNTQGKLKVHRGKANFTFQDEWEPWKIHSLSDYMSPLFSFQSSTFRKSARQVSRKMWWKNTKMTLILILIVVVVITVLVLIILYATGVFNKDSGSHTTPALTTTPHQ